MGNGVALANAAVPTGWTSAIPSLRPGHVLHLFTPAPVSELARHLRERTDETSESQTSFTEQALACLAYGAVLRRRMEYATDKQVESAISHYRDYVLRTDETIRLQKLIHIASAITAGKAKELRCELTYAGPVAKSTSLLYAREDYVEPLIVDLLESISSLSQTVDPFEFACVVVFCALNIHPFKDGNGRIARFLATHATARLDAPLAGAICSSLQYWQKPWFEDLAVRSRSAGLLGYLEEFRARRAQVNQAIAGSTLLYRLNTIGDELKAVGPTPRNLRHAILEGMLVGSASEQQLRKRSGISSKLLTEILSNLQSNGALPAQSTSQISFAQLQHDIEKVFLPT